MPMTPTSLTLFANLIGELQEKPAFRARIDYYPGLVVQGGRAAARLRGIAKS